MNKPKRDAALRELQKLVQRRVPQPLNLPTKPRRPKGVVRPRASIGSIMHCAACGAVGSAGATCAACGEKFRR